MKITYLLFLALLCSCGKGNSNNKGQTSDQSSSYAGEEKVNSRASFRFDHVFKSFENKQAAYKPSDERYTSLVVRRDPKITELNHQNFEKGLRTVSLVGIDIELGGPNSHAAYDLISKAFDIKELNIEARSLVIKAPIHVAQANVNIKAKTVRFEGEGRIITTPAAREDQARVKQDGVSGLVPGRIEIQADKVLGVLDSASLIAMGGAGQAAGPGVDGARGTNAKIVKGSNYYYYKWRTLHSYGGREGGRDWIVHKKEGRRSTSGKNAQVGGMPGAGGKGGEIIIHSSKVEGVIAEVSGGAHGALDKVRVGGDPGSPATTCRLEYGKRKGCATAVKGKNAAPKKLSTEKGEDGSYKVENVAAPLSDQVAFQMIEHGKDLYLSRHIGQAKEIFEFVEAQFAGKELSSPQGMNALNGARANLTSIDMRLDYFGKEKTWAPSLSFTAASQAFRKEGAKALRLYMLTEELLKEGAKLEERRSALVELREELLEANTRASQRITSAVLEDANLRKSIADLTVAEEEFRWELKRVEAQIKRMARNNLRVPGWKKTLGVVSALSKTIPVGQPTFGAVGMGIDIVTKGLEGKYGAGDLINDVPSIARSFEGFDWKKSTGELDAKLKELDPRDFMSLPDNKAKLEYLKKVANFANPMAQEIKGQLATWKERETSRSALDAEIQKIKRGHKVYKRLVAKLEKVLSKKSEFYKLARALNQSALKELENIENNFLTIAYAFDDIELFSTQELMLAVSSLNNQAQRRMKRYSYTMVKAYEYQYLHSFPLGGDLKGFFSKASKLIGQSGNISEKMEKLEVLFEGEVSGLTQSVILSPRKRDELTKLIKLNPEEVQALNDGEAIFLDFTDLSFFGEDKENVRLHSVELDERSLYNGGAFEMSFKHIGQGMVQYSGEFYFFSHARPEVWLSSSQYGEVYHSSPSMEAGEAIATSLELDPAVQVFSRPSGRSFVKTELKGQNSELKEVYIRARYSFEHAREPLK